MKYLKFSVVLFLTVAMSSCANDDDAPIPVVPPRDRGEQQIEDDIALVNYLESHYYNASLFDTPGDYDITDIEIKELPKDANGNYLALPNPDTNKILKGVVETKNTTFEETSYKYYILRINQGGGESVNFTDALRLNYAGSLEDGTVFDSAINPSLISLVGNGSTTFGAIQGWKEVMPSFETAEGDAVINDDGTVTYNNYGFGVMFLPSGLGYFNSSVGSIPGYSNLIFKFAIFEAIADDLDRDGVPSHLEDLNTNGDVMDDDTDGDGIPNFVDTDDDGDGVLTRFEDLDNDGDPTNDDSNGNGIPNYLDADSTETNQI